VQLMYSCIAPGGIFVPITLQNLFITHARWYSPSSVRSVHSWRTQTGEEGLCSLQLPVQSVAAADQHAIDNRLLRCDRRRMDILQWTLRLRFRWT